MRLPEKEELSQKSMDVIKEITDMYHRTPVISFDNFVPEQTVLIIVDMINGFAREGALMSPRVEALIPDITKLMKDCLKLKIPMVAFADSHTNESPEFTSYPPHCMKNTTQEDIVEEIKDLGGYLLIPKNSTNGFLEAEFQKWLQEHNQRTNFIVVGDCTDICIQQFAITLKTWFNMQNINARIIVPINAVDTYDLGTHYADLMNVIALYNMTMNGVEVVADVR